MSKTQEIKKRRRKYPNVFFKKELTALFDAIDNPRTMVAAFLAFFCALRISEVCKIKWQDIDLKEKRLKVVDGKNHKDGFIPLSSLCIPILEKWKAINEGYEYVFPSYRNDSPFYCRHALLLDLRKYLEKAGLNIITEKTSSGHQQHQYKFHTLRHSRCTHLLSNGVPIEKVQKFMRHDEIDTTMTYTWILDKELNKMVEEADSGSSNLPEEIGGFTSNNKIIIKQTEDPLTIAQKRFARGEISTREYKRIIQTLNGTEIIQKKASLPQNNISEAYL